MRNENTSFRRILTASANLAVLSFAFFLFPSVSHGQTNVEENREKNPLVVEIVEQKDSPILISSASVDDSSESNYKVDYVVQNVSGKNILIAVFTNNRVPGLLGFATTHFRLFADGKIKQEMMRWAKDVRKPTEKLTLAVDYVVFEDGSAWGADSVKMSEYIAGMKAAQENIVNRIKNLSSDEAALADFLRQNSAEIESLESDAKQSDRWRRGFMNNYKYYLLRFQSAYASRGLPAVVGELKELEKTTAVPKAK